MNTHIPANFVSDNLPRLQPGLGICCEYNDKFILTTNRLPVHIAMRISIMCLKLKYYLSRIVADSNSILWFCDGCIRMVHLKVIGSQI